MNVCVCVRGCVLQKWLKKVNQAKLNFVPLEMSMMIEIFLFNNVKRCARFAVLLKIVPVRESIWDLIRSHTLKIQFKEVRTKHQMGERRIYD